MSSPRQSTRSEKRPSNFWWLFAIAILSICVLVQLPVSWLVQKFVPDAPYLQWVSGNIWQGAATWQTPKSSETSSINGKTTWQWKPLKLLIGRISADVEITSGQSRLSGEINTSLFGFDSLQVHNLSGRIHQDTLATLVDWQLPDAPIQVNKLSITYDKNQGFEEADGEMTWIGGQLGYPNAGKILQINLPSMRADISTKEVKNNQGNAAKDNQDNSNALQAHLVDQDNKTLGDFSVDSKGMLDVSLTQRLLENMPSYNGSAPQDTAVVSIRQPLTSLGSPSSSNGGNP